MRTESSEVPHTPTPEFPDTRFTLLRRLPDAADFEAWQNFTKVYVPVICAFYMHRGCPAESAAELTKAVMIRVAEEIGEFIPVEGGSGRFRDWLFVRVMDALTERHPDLAVLPFESPPSADKPATPASEARKLWEEEYRRRAYRQAADEMLQELGEGKNWEIFRRTILEHEDPAQVATDLGITLGSIYLTRSRVLNRMRERLAQIEIDWESGAAKLSETLGEEQP